MADESMELKVDEPHYGFSGFDDDSFKQEVKLALENLEKKTNEA